MRVFLDFVADLWYISIIETGENDMTYIFSYPKFNTRDEFRRLPAGVTLNKAQHAVLKSGKAIVIKTFVGNTIVRIKKEA